MIYVTQSILIHMFRPEFRPPWQWCYYYSNTNWQIWLTVKWNTNLMQHCAGFISAGLHQVGVSFDLHYDARKHKIKIWLTVSSFQNI